MDRGHEIRKKKSSPNSEPFLDIFAGMQAHSVTNKNNNRLLVNHDRKGSCWTQPTMTSPSLTASPQNIVFQSIIFQGATLELGDETTFVPFCGD